MSGRWRMVRTLAACLLAVQWSGLHACAQKAEPQMVEMKFRTLRAIPSQQSAVIILEEAGGGRFLPIYIDENQAVSIYFAQRGEAPSRPLTHDLFVKVMKTLKAGLDRVVITDLREGVYYADLVVQRGDEQISIDARPSDAIALALRFRAPIFASEKLLEEHPTGGAGKPSVEQVTQPEWGLVVQALTPAMQKFFEKQKGLLIADVIENSPADRAGLAPGDLLVEVAGKKLSTLAQFREAVGAVGKKTEVLLRIWREGQSLEFTLKLK